MDETQECGEWWTACQNYTTRVAAAEHAAWLKRKNPRKSDRFQPSQYVKDLCDLLGKNDEEGFKTLKMLEGRHSAIKV